ncbi:MAG: hypothetical protein EF813_11180 [Methanosarcinales archaeon]|nr:MAG: hypothetical protein EF813_11180 [Methanosarcinales archaeon]
MNVIVLDSDALIKLTEANCLEKILGALNCFISGDVCEEAVVSGVRRFYEDAFQIDRWVWGGKLTVEETVNNKIAQDVLKGSKLGKGESSTLHLFFNNECLIDNQ